MFLSLEPRKISLKFLYLIATLSICSLVACNEKPEEQTNANMGVYTDSISGKDRTLIGKSVQKLPLEPERLIEFQTSSGTALSLDVAPDGRTLVFDMLGDIYVLEIGSERTKALTSGMAVDTEPVYSPSGSEILFLSDRSGAENLWVVDANGQNAKQISFYDDNPVFISPEWSPDGKTIMVTRFWPDRNAYELWQFSRNNDSLGQVVRSSDKGGVKTSAIGATFAIDGTFIYFASLQSSNPSFDKVSPWEIVARDLETDEESVIISARNETGGAPKFRPLLSPDGTTLAYAERNKGKTYLKALNLKTQDRRTLTDLDPDFLQASLWHDIIPRFDFTPDSKSIIINKDGGIKRIILKTGNIETIPFKATVKQKLGKLVRPQVDIEQGDVRARIIQSATLSPDNSQIAFSALGRLYVKGLKDNTAPKLLLDKEGRGYHPGWSADGMSIAYVTWNSRAGGGIRLVSVDDQDSRSVELPPAFYTHPVFVPGEEALLVIRSPFQTRQSTYMEFGQFRESDLLYVPLNGGAPHVVISGKIGGTPHFKGDKNTVLLNFYDGVYAVSLENGTKTAIAKAEGPNWYFESGPAHADDLRVSPDGRWVLAQIAHQLYIFERPENPNDQIALGTTNELSKKITRAGADYFGWSATGESLFWTVGSSFNLINLSDLDFDEPQPTIELNPIESIVTIERDIPKGRILLRGGNVITMKDRGSPEVVIPNADILINRARIEAITLSGELRPASDTHIVDVTGKYIIPGIIDAHYHIADIRRDVLDFDEWGLKTSLAYGVTTLFDPSSLSIDMLAYQDLVDTGDVLGSRIFTTGPAIFDYYDFRSIEDVRAVLGRYKYNYRLSNIKQYRSGNRRVRQWIAQVSDELDLVATTEGALSFKLDLSQIIDGYAGVEHAMPPTTHYSDLRTLFAKSGTSNNLTLMNTHGGLPALSNFINRSDSLNSSKFSYFAPDWFSQNRAEEAKVYQDSNYSFPDVARTGLMLHEAGGVVGVGAHGDVPGLGTHWEIQAYVEGGWSPAKALWAATMGSATAIGRDENLGSLEPGKLADLVILEANPLEDITNSLLVHSVIKNGEMYDGDSLELLAND